MEAKNMTPPGPWTATSYTYQDESNDEYDAFVSEVAGPADSLRPGDAFYPASADGRSKDEAEANARLVASAPAMLAALENVLVWLPTGYETGVVSGEYGHLLDSRKSIEALLALARGA